MLLTVNSCLVRLRLFIQILQDTLNIWRPPFDLVFLLFQPPFAVSRTDSLPDHLGDPRPPPSGPFGRSHQRGHWRRSLDVLGGRVDNLGGHKRLDEGLDDLNDPFPTLISYGNRNFVPLPPFFLTRVSLKKTQ